MDASKGGVTFFSAARGAFVFGRPPIPDSGQYSPRFANLSEPFSHGRLQRELPSKSKILGMGGSFLGGLPSALVGGSIILPAMPTGHSPVVCEHLDMGGVVPCPVSATAPRHFTDENPAGQASERSFFFCDWCGAKARTGLASPAPTHHGPHPLVGAPMGVCT